MYSQMQEQFSRGEISEVEWQRNTEELNQADLKINSAVIFAEKAEQFAALRAVSPAHYIYEYCWQTVYTLL